MVRRIPSLVIMIWRIGQFLVFLGLIILIIYIASMQVNKPEFLYFCSGVIFVFLGGYAMWHNRNSGLSADRFRSIRKFGGKRKKKNGK